MRLIIILLVVFWLIFLRPTFLLGDTSYIIVVGHSMEPTFYHGDLVIAKKSDNYTNGDIIVYKHRDTYVVHRIVEVTDKGYRTQGDNNPNPDPWLLRKEDVLGKAIIHVPYFGYILAFARTPVGVFFISFIFLLTLMPGMTERRGEMYLTKKQMILAFLIGTFIVLAIASGFVNRMDEKTAIRIEEVEQRHYGNFSYVAHLKPNVLYGKTELRPGEGAIYSNLLEFLLIRFNYRSEGKEAFGNYSVHVYIENPDEWIKEIDYIPKKSFRNSFGFNYTLNLSEIQRLIEIIEEETGVSGSYRVKIVPEIEFGREKFEPSLNISIGGKVIDIKKLNHVRNITAERTVFIDNKIGFLSVSLLKKIMLFCSIANIIAISYVAVFMRTSEEEMLRAVESETVPKTEKVIRLKSAKDLAKIAQNTGKQIIKCKDVYYILDGDIRYEFKKS